MKFEIRILEEAGYWSAIDGLMLSYGTKDYERAEIVAEQLAQKDGGHNKFLESIFLWFEIRAPRYWWQEADTYRLSTKQSESTMHTLVQKLRSLCIEEYKDFINQNFEWPVPLEVIETLVNATDLHYIKAQLPEGFLQTRIWCMNYKTLRNIILQRYNHKLPHWQEFCKYVYKECIYDYLLPKGIYEQIFQNGK